MVQILSNGEIVRDSQVVVYHRERRYSESESSSSEDSSHCEEEILEPELNIKHVGLDMSDISVVHGITYFGITFAEGDSVDRRKIVKRYSQFEELAGDIGFKDDFPRKHFFSCKGTKLETRRFKLESWLRSALRHQKDFPEMRPCLREFLYDGSLVLVESALPPLPMATSVVPQTPSVQAPRQAGSLMQIDIPPGMQAGQSLQVAVPDGRQLSIVIPEGYVGGMVAQLAFNAQDGSLIFVV